MTLEKFYKTFGDYYRLIHAAWDHDLDIAGTDEAARAYDHWENKPLDFIRAFVKMRGDGLDGTAETAAFMFTCEKYGMLDNAIFQ